MKKFKKLDNDLFRDVKIDEKAQSFIRGGEMTEIALGGTWDGASGDIDWDFDYQWDGELVEIPGPPPGSLTGLPCPNCP